MTNIYSSQPPQHSPYTFDATSPPDPLEERVTHDDSLSPQFKELLNHLFIKAQIFLQGVYLSLYAAQPRQIFFATLITSGAFAFAGTLGAQLIKHLMPGINPVSTGISLSLMPPILTFPLWIKECQPIGFLKGHIKTVTFITVLISYPTAIKICQLVSLRVGYIDPVIGLGAFCISSVGVMGVVATAILSIASIYLASSHLRSTEAN